MSALTFVKKLVTRDVYQRPPSLAPRLLEVFEIDADLIDAHRSVVVYVEKV